jgi:dipeptidase D
MEVAMAVLDGLEPKLIWKHFEELTKIPRPSGQEEKAAAYVIDYAKKLGLEYDHDETGNVVIRKPASPGFENSPTVVLQGHLDMVCEKNSDKKFDWDNDPIELVIDGDWLKANGTTLGADNGIGLAASLAILEDDSIKHGPLEALFTVDEERGLVGAMSISPDALKGRYLLNLDSEDLGLFSIGCAGGRDSHLTLPITRKSASGDTLVKLHLSGLRGGHSGIDIHEGRGNAVKILNRLLYQVNKVIPVELVCLFGGDKHNAIPREAVAEVVVVKTKLAELTSWFDKALEDLRAEFKPVETNITFSAEKLEEKLPRVLNDKSQDEMMALIFALPHGPLAMSRTIEGLVETSNNVAAIKCDDDAVKLHLAARSSNGRALDATIDKICSIASLAGASVDLPPGYPGWMPDLDSKLLKVAMDAYKAVTGEEARYEAIHAGLECGLIGEKYPGMDMISYGPSLKHPHSPDEKLKISDVPVFYEHTLKILEMLL